MVLLSFDIEEFDMPLEYNGIIPFEEQLQVSRNGLQNILAILKKHEAKATFFSTVIFADHNRDLIEALLADGHELASHTWFHSQFSIEDLKKSKDWLQETFNTEITGLRMPRMMEVDAREVENAGYTYNSSVNPTWLPGRYNNLKVSRKYFPQGNTLQIPASVSPWRIPLFWLSFHNFPVGVYRKLAKRALQKDGYLNIYFHPWEFMDITKKEYALPSYTSVNTGEKMVQRFDGFVSWLKQNNYKFGTFKDFLETIK
ncbi:TPA: polysaccharide deacetylase family protein [Elizabethkingia meningoseptica]|uniref:polysaccharide deacetylase family protein n=1 Tax=Elizabethkingia meningoseptica TaxID=238 RepID=UPI0022F1C259|nr:polysaccharide deacetylase family protein [Elizabethkingia meningoseptica]EJK5327594.1 polysaccharide deacetylase family protein [Elizabethkingia meningoseptica]WBS74825.1 polysaccharide deacetylase family protein [Elizabethkingia meningoseptica]HAY3561756.1 polysaccharide deacetylase family protein [Elizabethkingia meningoseptica]